MATMRIEVPVGVAESALLALEAEGRRQRGRVPDEDHRAGDLLHEIQDEVARLEEGRADLNPAEIRALANRLASCLTGWRLNNEHSLNALRSRRNEAISVVASGIPDATRRTSQRGV